MYLVWYDVIKILIVGDVVGNEVMVMPCGMMSFLLSVMSLLMSLW